MWNFARIWIRFKKEILLAYALVRDPRSPLSSKLLIGAAVLYVLMPFDLIPDIPLLGWLDDGLIAYVLLQFATRLLPPDLLQALKTRVGDRSAASARARPMRG